MLGGLPLEVWLHVGEQIDEEPDLSALARTCQSMYYALRPVLYRHNAENSESTALLWASEQGIESVVRLALLHGADVNAEYGSQDRALHLAAREGHGSIVALLLDIASEDIHPDLHNYEGETPLICAAARGDSGIVRQLLGVEGVDPNARQVEGIDQSALSIAATEGFVSVVEALLEKEETNLNDEDEDELTPLTVAARRGHEKVVRLLLDSGRAEVNHTLVDHSPLFCAATMGQAACVTTLLQDSRVDVNVYTDDGISAYSSAASRGHMAVVRAFLESGKVDVGALDGAGNNDCSSR